MTGKDRRRPPIINRRSQTSRLTFVCGADSQTKTFIPDKTNLRVRATLRRLARLRVRDTSSEPRRSHDRLRSVGAAGFLGPDQNAFVRNLGDR
jgi:hypothetical protein